MTGFHVHASDSRLTEEGSAKFFVREDGSSVIQRRGILSEKELNRIQQFIKENYKDMYRTWQILSDNDFYKK